MEEESRTEWSPNLGGGVGGGWSGLLQKEQPLESGPSNWGGGGWSGLLKASSPLKSGLLDGVADLLKDSRPLKRWPFELGVGGGELWSDLLKDPLERWPLKLGGGEGSSEMAS